MVGRMALNHEIGVRLPVSEHSKIVRRGGGIISSYCDTMNLLIMRPNKIL